MVMITTVVALLQERTVAMVMSIPSRQCSRCSRGVVATVELARGN